MSAGKKPRACRRAESRLKTYLYGSRNLEHLRKQRLEARARRSAHPHLSMCAGIVNPTYTCRCIEQAFLLPRHPAPKISGRHAEAHVLLPNALQAFEQLHPVLPASYAEFFCLSFLHAWQPFSNHPPCPMSFAEKDYVSKTSFLKDHALA